MPRGSKNIFTDAIKMSGRTALDHLRLAKDTDLSSDDGFRSLLLLAQMMRVPDLSLIAIAGSQQKLEDWRNYKSVPTYDERKKCLAAIIKELERLYP